ncbi:hypothetical protein HOO65_020865 [Ceratocystis lukuohia]|uniref:Uncharacterized protein n=1 Tax=Ceratocystis lukuohia TaxID=2019550 RepID=A0ABR4MPW7_9PEZI
MLSSVPRTVARRQSLPSSAVAMGPVAFTRSLATRARHHRSESVAEDAVSQSFHEFNRCHSVEHMHLPVGSDARAACRQIAAHYWSAANGSQADKVARWRASSESMHYNTEKVSSSLDLGHLWQTPLQKTTSSSNILRSASQMSFLHDASHMQRMPASRRSVHTQSSSSSYYIDPITNKKVASPSAPRSNFEVGSFGSYQRAESVSEYDDLHMYRRSKIDSIVKTSALSGSSKYEDLHLYGPTTSPINIKSKKEPVYPDLHKYASPVGGPVLHEAETFPEYNDLHLYGPATVDNLLVDTTIPEYEDIHEYNVDHIHHETPVGVVGKASKNMNPVDEIIASHVSVPAEDKSAEYTDLHKYVAVKWNEPNGERPLTEEEKSKNYKDLHLYDGPVVFNEPHGKGSSSPEELSKKYEDLHHYDGPVLHSEPDGAAGKLTPEELSKKYRDLHLYDGPHQHLEPHGLPPKTAEELSKNYKDLDQYDGPHLFNEPHGELAASKEEMSKNYTDLDSYGPVFYQEPDGKPTNKYAQSSSASASSENHHNAASNSQYTNDLLSAANGLPQRHLRQTHQVSRSLNRASLDYDPYSIVPQGLEISYSEEIGAPSAGLTHVRSFGIVSPNMSAPTNIETNARNEIFRVFVYDDALDKMSVAETQTETPDGHQTMSPTEALLKLSHPAKFLPFFENLRAQGFEIVASNGNVLVFHKVRGDGSAIPRVVPIDRSCIQFDLRPDYSLSPMGGHPIRVDTKQKLDPISREETDFVSMLEKQNSRKKPSRAWGILRKTVVYSVVGYGLLKTGEQMGQNREAGAATHAR